MSREPIDYGMGVALIPFAKDNLRPFLEKSPAWAVIDGGTKSRIVIRTVEDFELLEREATAALGAVQKANESRRGRGRPPGGSLASLLAAMRRARAAGLEIRRLVPPKTTAPQSDLAKVLAEVAPLAEGDLVAFLSRRDGAAYVGTIRRIRDAELVLSVGEDAVALPREWCVKVPDIPAHETCEVGSFGDTSREHWI